MAKYILYKEDARRALLKGIEIMVEAVAVTLGPRGRNVVIEKKFGLPQIINDGVSIAKEITLKDNIQNTGVSLVRQAALKTNEVAGDGTTTSTVLAYAIIREGMKILAAGANPISLKVGIDLATKFIVQKINDIAQPVDDLEGVSQVAALSAGNDLEVGEMIAGALEVVGRDGIISLEEGKSTVTELDFAEGLTFEKGFLSPYFINQIEKREVIFENPYILVTDKKITLVQQELIPILEQVKKTGRPLLIVAEDFSQEALATLVLNNLRRIVEVAAVRAPGFGASRKAFLEDLVILTRGTLVTEDTGLTLKKIKLTSFGEAKKVKITENSTSILNLSQNNASVEDEVKLHCERLRKQQNLTDDSYEKQQLQDRIAKLVGGVAIIKVGAITETEMKEKKLRLEDAINATKAAIDEGVVPGGGTIFVHLAAIVRDWASVNLSGDEQIGAMIVSDAIKYPLIRIAKNAGMQSGPLIIEKLLGETSTNIGYDASIDTIVDMYQSGIIDPAKVSRSSLQNAASIASMILTTECVIVEMAKK